MQGMWFDISSALFAVLSAGFWIASARVSFPFGYDMDEELSKAAKKAGKLNAIAASLAAIAALLPAIKAIGAYKGWLI